MAEERGTSSSAAIDMFDDVVLIEQKLHSDGYNEGFYKGQLDGELQGFSLGVERGKAFGQEVGFYEGFASTLSIIYANEPASGRLLKVLAQMSGIIERIWHKDIDPQNQDLFDDLEAIRAKFKQVSSMVNATPEYGKQTLDF